MHDRKEKSFRFGELHPPLVGHSRDSSDAFEFLEHCTVTDERIGCVGASRSLSRSSDGQRAKVFKYLNT